MYWEKLSKLGESSNQAVKSIFASKKNRLLYKSMHSDFLCNDDFHNTTLNMFALTIVYLENLVN